MQNRDDRALEILRELGSRPAAPIGAGAVLTSFVLELRRGKSGAFEMEGVMPLTFILSLGSLWGRSHKSMSRN